MSEARCSDVVDAAADDSSVALSGHPVKVAPFVTRPVFVATQLPKLVWLLEEVMPGKIS
jgi:hypothetical protein